MRKETILKICNALVLPTFLYGSENLTLNSLTKTKNLSGRNEVTETSGRLHPLCPQNKWPHTLRTADYRLSRQDRWTQMELAFTLAKNATIPNPFEIIPLQTARKENSWKTKEALAWEAVTLETEKDQWVQSLIFMMMIVIKIISIIMCVVLHVDKYKIIFKLFINSRDRSGRPVQLMPGPGTGPRPSDWETVAYTADDDKRNSWTQEETAISKRHVFKFQLLNESSERALSRVSLIYSLCNLHNELSKYSWINRDQLKVTCFFISLFNAQHVSDVNTSILRSLRLICTAL